MSIPTSLIVVLLVVAWLVVLVPMVARRREKVPQAEATGSGFRVLRRASASLRRRPRRGAKGQTVTSHDAAGRVVGRRSGAGQRRGARFGARAHRRRRGVGGRTARSGHTASGPDRRRTPWPSSASTGTPATRRDVEDRHTDVITVVELGESADDRIAEPSTGRSTPVSIAPDDRADASVQTPIRGRAIPDELDEQEWAEHAAAAPAGPAFADVQDEQLRPVPRRPGRGGFDPEAAEATRAYRYQQRRRITLILLIATVAFSVTAFLFVSWLWIGAAVSLALLVGYLSLPASSGADRGRDPAEADGAAAAGPADPARICPPPARGQPGRHVRRRARPHRRRP